MSATSISLHLPHRDTYGENGRSELVSRFQVHCLPGHCPTLKDRNLLWIGWKKI